MTTRSRRVASPRKAARVRCRPELAQERVRGSVQQVARSGPEGPHQLRRPGLRDTEEPFEIAAGEEVAVERLELADGVGDGEEPAGRGGHRG